MKRLIPFVLFIAACNPSGTNRGEVGQQQGYAPIYASRQAVNTIQTEAPRPTARPGKIYAFGSYLFQVENGEGIHIINNSNPQTARKIAFLKIPMATEIAIKANHLYTNNLNDMVVFDLSNMAAPQLVNRIANAFPVVDQTFPPVSGVYYECADATKGVVVGWEQKMITNPKCRR